MSSMVSPEQKMDNIQYLVEFRRENSNKSIKRVLAKKNDEIIFNDDVTVIIGDYNTYFRVDIIWEDAISDSEYHSIGLRGYYSSDYCIMKYSQNTLEISTDDGVVITIIA